jgi:DNA transposition AAA+ family ATPase
MELQNAGENSPRFGVLHGPPGYGKTYASSFAQNETGAAYVEFCSIWTVKSFLTELSREIGIAKPARTSPAILAELIEQLNVFPRPIIIDEADYLVKKQMVDVARDLHDKTPCGIMLVGMESLPQKLKRWDQFHSRILTFTPAAPASAADALMLRDVFCQDVEVADDLVEHFRVQTKKNARRIRVNLEEAQRFATAEGMGRIDRALWGNRRVITGDPVTRKVPA